jgi:predicted CXXCH cytochrome family protein
MMAAGMLLLDQCSPYAGKSLLHIFFDGVPEADTVATAQEESGDMPADSASNSETLAASALHGLYIHYPYEERECGTCHNEQSIGSMIESQPDLCYTCHENLADQYKYLHGPVAGGYCTACHDPHMSENEHLLRMTGKELCFHCHQAESVQRSEMHQGLEDMLCTDCHNPHGGEDKYILQ